MSQPFVRNASPTRLRAARAAAWLMALVLPAAAAATEVKLFRADSRSTFLEGELEGVAIDPLGAISLAERLSRLAAVDEPFVYAAAPYQDGWVLGTGSTGRVLLIDEKGAVRTLFETEAPNVFAVAVSKQGDVYAASSPDGAVYRLAAGSEKAEVIFDPEATYVWRLVDDGDGGLLVATGLPGHLYRIDAARKARASQAPSLLLDAGDVHVRSLAVAADRTIYIGTAGRGRLLRLDRDGRSHTLYDGNQPEVVDLALAPDGTLYAALLASEASLVDLSAKRKSSAKDEAETKATVDVSVEGQTTVGSRPAGASGVRSALIAVRPDGGIEQLWSHESDTLHSLLWSADSLWLGSGEEGRLYRWHGDRVSLEHDLDASQITALAQRPDGRIAVATTNEAGLYLLGGGPAAEGVYTSGVLDAGAVADFGTFFWHGELPAGSRVEFALRSGMATSPDGTWSDWIDVAAGDRERALAALPSGRFVQWRASLAAGKTAGPRLVDAEISYRQRNQAPKLTSLEVLDPGQILVEANFNPQNQTFEPWSPNREGIFTSLKPSDGSDDSGRLKNLWKRGYRTVRWKAEDANDDALRYRLELRPDDAPDDAWLTMAEDLESSHFSFDATVLPDGIYRFRVIASDRAAQADRSGLDDREISAPAVIDHTPPVLRAVRRAGGAHEAEIEDARSPVREAAWSADGAAWTPAVAVDGLVDGRREMLRIPAPEGARLLLLRVMDAAFNVVTFDLLAIEKAP